MTYQKKNYRGNNKHKFNKGGNNFYGRHNKRRRGPRKENIHPSKFIKEAKLIKEKEYKAKNKFS